MGRAFPRPAELDDAVGPVPGQVSVQVDAQSMELRQMLPPMGILTGAELELKLGPELILLTLELVLGFPGSL